MAQLAKESACNAESVPVREDPLEKGIGYPLSILGLPYSSADKEPSWNVRDLGLILG